MELIDDGTLSAHSKSDQDNAENRSFEGSFYEDDEQIDAFTKKRLPKAEDFFPNNQVPETLKSANNLAMKKHLQKQTLNTEQIISPQNQRSKPQNHMILADYAE